MNGGEGKGMKRWLLLIGLAVAITGCAEIKPGDYPKSWPALAGLGQGCRSLAGTYQNRGMTSNPETNRNQLSHFILKSGTQGIQSGHTIRFTFAPDDRLTVEVLRNDVVVDMTTWRPGESGYGCDGSEATIPTAVSGGVAGYNSASRTLTKATDGSLIVRNSFNMAGVWMLPPMPVVAANTEWARFEEIK